MTAIMCTLDVRGRPPCSRLKQRIGTPPHDIALCPVCDVNVIATMRQSGKYVEDK